MNYGALVEEFESDWQSYMRVEVTRSIIVAAGELAERQALRGCDAIHLASAVRLQAATDEPVQVVTHDSELRTVVVAAGLVVLPAAVGG